MTVEVVRRRFFEKPQTAVCFPGKKFEFVEHKGFREMPNVVTFTVVDADTVSRETTPIINRPDFARRYGYPEMEPPENKFVLTKIFEKEKIDGLRVPCKKIGVRKTLRWRE